ncbi:L,D-transpeptidase family protein [Solitalea sp. MAHUQ-68]|uniref:L,D-transpeptidase family protein n=1 Tax=Solitalea agri TaxID=2953739 RepID=A0A9X2JD40_9SPHI|nr:L,D-transpeptidase family protein [Solitalea agri]MCO4293199.1 L,D-transpeptidase family protein [Solitalea agri]
MILLRLAFAISLLFFTTDEGNDSFKKEQLANERVKNAYDNTAQQLFFLLSVNGVEKNKLQILLCAYKNEKAVELWARNKGEVKYKLIKQYSICSSSGILGPKRREGDRQVPEGFYIIDRFNPKSLFHLSLGINYPNKSDKILGEKYHLGGDVFIHGKCVTIGCIPLTDERINELYVLAVEATNNGQSAIPVYIFPFRMSDENFKHLMPQYSSSKELKSFWMNLKTGYQKFQRTAKPLNFEINKQGRYVFL